MVALVLGLALSGCATLPQVTLVSATEDVAALRAANSFYAASTPQELAAAVEAARAASPDSAVTHELAFRHAMLLGRDDEALTALLAALRDVNDDAPLLHLHQLSWLDITRAQRPAVEAHLRALWKRHPSAQVRAAAAFQLTAMLYAQGDLAALAEAASGVEGRLDFAVVGTWDNDQGKGYDLELGPELRPGLDQTYEGRVARLRWRPHAPVDPRGRIELGALMTPARWAVAYAQTQVVTKPGFYQLRIATADPLKVWVDGVPVFAAPQLDRLAFDQLIIPLRLEAGIHRIMIKSAHRTSAWTLLARLVPAESFDRGPATVESSLATQVRELRSGFDSSRGWAHRTAWSHYISGGPLPVKLADAWVKRSPKSILARLVQADSLWYNQERGRTADLLAALDTDVGEALPFVRLRHARFLFQQGLKQKARAKLTAVRPHAPKSREAFDLAIELFRAEGWQVDELNAERDRAAQLGETSADIVEYARSLQRNGRRAEAVAAYQRVLEWLPLHADALDQLAELRRDGGELTEAKALLQKRLASWPTDVSTWLDLAEVCRRLGQRSEAVAALARASALNPDASAPEVARGELAYEAGDSPAALKAWRHALELHPENEALANRIEALAPEARGPWAADAPDEAAIDRAVRKRDEVKQAAGADTVWLLDHEVTQLNTDGSTTNVVTLVLHAFNAQGRDRIIRQTVPAGRLRMLHAYSVDEKGVRSEAASERNSQIFFRGMQPGSTLVLQYRLDVPPTGYLSRYLTQSWSFQGVADQRADSTYVLWAPLGTVLHERKVGSVERSEERRGDQLRIVWTAKDVPPLLAEPSMPPVVELAANIRLSSVPDWKTWLSWEQALLEGVFRDSPQLEAVAKELGEGASTADQKLERIHTYVMEEIRYQQDYETFIAGVKPHAAPMTLERRYGDCKDKAVLFIELARKLGLDAQFALVRTRDAGPADPEVPMQQFNHAVVYVPAQQGVTAGRFFDPTADLLDVAAVRPDDVGTQSLVFDPTNGAHQWREIPFQAPEVHRETSTAKLTVSADGSARGTFRIEAVGRGGSLLRRFARNQESLAQGLQRMANTIVPGATSSQPRAESVSLAQPALLTTDIEVAALAMPEGETLRLKLPAGWNPREHFALATRRHPMVLGVPAQYETKVELELPDGWEVRKASKAGMVDLPCLKLERDVRTEGRQAKVSTRVTFRCERITAAEYSVYRARLDEMVRLLEDELVMAPKPGKKLPAKTR